MTWETPKGLKIKPPDKEGNWSIEFPEAELDDNVPVAAHTGWTTGQYEQQNARAWRPIVGARVIVERWPEFPGTITQAGPEQSEIRFDFEQPWGKLVYMPNSWLVVRKS